MATPQQSPVKIGLALSTLQLWAEDLLVLTNRKPDTDESAVRRLRDDFRNSVYPSRDGPLSLRESASKMLFETVGAGFGKTHHPSAGGIFEKSPFAAWQKNVARSVYRQTFQRIEQIIVDSFARNGANATLDRFPAFSDPAEVAATLDYLNFEAKNLPAGAVAALLRGISETRKPQAKPAAAATP